MKKWHVIIPSILLIMFIVGLSYYAVAIYAPYVENRHAAVRENMAQYNAYIKSLETIGINVVHNDNLHLQLEQQVNLDEFKEVLTVQNATTVYTRFSMDKIDVFEVLYVAADNACWVTKFIPNHPEYLT